jgi:transposase
VLHPRAVKHFSRALQTSAKTDRIDAEVIAQFLLRLQPKPKAAPPEGLEELREVTRMRRKLIEERTTSKNRLHKLLRYHFPGYRKLLGNQLSNRLLLVLESMPSPDLIRERGIEKIAEIQNGSRHRIGTKFSENLLQLATQAPAATLRGSTRLLLQHTAKSIRELTARIAELDEIIEELLQEVFPGEVLTSIPGLGKVSAAAILAEIGDISRFEGKGQFIGYCGLYPIVWESGEFKRRYQMTFKGNRMLKMTILVASAAARQYNPVVADYYERLRRRGKSTKTAGGAIARKLAEIIFALLASNQLWSAEKAQSGLTKACAMMEEIGRAHV